MILSNLQTSGPTRWLGQRSRFRLRVATARWGFSSATSYSDLGSTAAAKNGVVDKNDYLLTPIRLKFRATLSVLKNTPHLH